MGRMGCGEDGMWGGEKAGASFQGNAIQRRMKDGRSTDTCLHKGWSGHGRRDDSGLQEGRRKMERGMWQPEVYKVIRVRRHSIHSRDGVDIKEEERKMERGTWKTSANKLSIINLLSIGTEIVLF